MVERVSKQLIFEPHTRLIFRKPVRFGVGDVSESFPLPPVSTLEGAIRTALGNAMGVDWEEYDNGNISDDVRKVIGDHTSPPPFTVSYPFLVIGKRVYIHPPFNLLVVKKGKKYEAVFIPFEAEVPGIPVKVPKLIDFEGRKREEGPLMISIPTLAELASDEGRWKEVRKNDDFVLLKDYVRFFWHTGIRIDKEKGTVYRKEGKGHVYREMGIEFKDGVKFGVVVVGVSPKIGMIDGKEIMLGGKGGVAKVNVGEVSVPVNEGGSRYWILYSPEKPGRDKVWEELFAKGPTGAALQGRSILTGYDLARKQGKPSLIVLPPSSVFYFESGYESPRKGIFITIK